MTSVAALLVCLCALTAQAQAKPTVRLYPLLSLDWDISPAFDLSVLLPVRVDFTWVAIDQRLEFGLRGLVHGNAFNLNGEERRIDTVRYSMVTAGLTAAVRAVGKIWFELSGGLTLARRLESDIADDDLQSVDLGDGAFVRAVVGLRRRRAGPLTRLRTRRRAPGARRPRRRSR